MSRSLFLSSGGRCLPELTGCPAKHSITIFPTSGPGDVPKVRVAPRAGSSGRSSVKIFPGGLASGFKSDSSSAPFLTWAAPQPAASSANQNETAFDSEGANPPGSNVPSCHCFPKGRWT